MKTIALPSRKTPARSLGAHRAAREARPRVRQAAGAFTLVELLIVIAIIALLAAILFPVFTSVRDKARAASCLNNLKQISLANLQYTEDNDGYFPVDNCAVLTTCSNTMMTPFLAQTAPRFPVLLDPYVKTPNVYLCPSETAINSLTPQYVGYWFNGPVFSRLDLSGRSNAEIPTPAQTVIAYDDCDSKNRSTLVFRLNVVGGVWSNDASVIQAGRNGPHATFVNCLYVDGHAKVVHSFNSLRVAIRFWIPTT